MNFLERFSGLVLMILSVIYFRNLYYKKTTGRLSLKGRGYIAACIFFTVGFLTLLGKAPLFEVICRFFERVSDRFNS